MMKKLRLGVAALLVATLASACAGDATGPVLDVDHDSCPTLGSGTC